MIKKFFKDSAIYSISGLISRGIAIFLVPFYTRIFSPNDYGIIDILAVFANVVTFTVGFEITQAVARFYPDTDSEVYKKNIASTGLLFTLLTYTIFLIIVNVFAVFFTSLALDDIIYLNIFRIWTASLFFNGLFYFLQNQLKWRLESKKFAIVSVTYTLVTIPSTILLVIVFRLDLYGVFIAKLFGAVVASALSFYFSHTDYIIVFKFKELKEMLKYSIPLVPAHAGVFF